ncbi:MAG: hypothetical protein EOM37_09245 [Proteobacteria bacterium]|jgi:hypothetical protein|nr:hypothetical protein [Alphaproteobacteria bacterium]NCC04209.1 hypothetical protein [Pseudomonadota bacterium]
MIKIKSVPHTQHAVDTKTNSSLPLRLSTQKLTDEEALLIGISSLRTVRSTINEKEYWAITSLVSYISYKQSIREDTVWAILAAQLGVENVKTLASARYDEAVRFLVDLDTTRVIN